MPYKVLEAIGHSYVVNDGGEPLITYYSDDTRLFTSKKIATQTVPCFLNIRRPVVIDVLNERL